MGMESKNRNVYGTESYLNLTMMNSEMIFTGS